MKQALKQKLQKGWAFAEQQYETAWLRHPHVALFTMLAVQFLLVFLFGAIVAFIVQMVS